MSETYTISAVCAEFGVTPRTLRFYESRGLLAPIRQGQKRLFTRRDLARLKLILRGKRFGFALSEIKELLGLYEIDDGQVTQLSAALDASERQHKLLTTQHDEIGQAITDLEKDMAEIRQMLEARGINLAAE